MVIVIEDYVPPSDIAAAAAKTGLIDYVYKGPLAEPLPTLHQIVDIGRPGGDDVRERRRRPSGALVPPRLRRAAPGDAVLVQAAPTAARSRPAARKLRRQPRPAIGAAVPGQPLDRHLAGAEALERGEGQRPARRSCAGSSTCERRRDLLANFISVDFYREGDLFGVIDELNAARAAPNA